MDTKKRKQAIDKEDKLSLVKQCKLLNINRSNIYYLPAGEKKEDLYIMKLIDEIHLKRPFYGVRRIKDDLFELGHIVNRKKITRLMKLMNIEALYPKPRLSLVNKAHKIYPYLLRNLTINRPNQVWATDITYIPMAKGFIYLTVIMDWYSRKILSWRLSNTMDTSFCLDALEEAIDYYGKPEIFNTDQGSQYTSDDFIGVLKDNEIKISMDGKGAWRDNVFVERLWRSVKYEEVYLNAYESMKEAKKRIGNWIMFYNTERKHQTLGTTPDLMYDQFSQKLAA